MDARSLIKSRLREGARLRNDLIKQAPLIHKIAVEAVSLLKRGGKVIVFGNGGSASDSQHMAAELVGRFSREKKPLPAIALTADGSIITAVGNDYGYEYSFSKQLEAHGRKGDIVFAISTSGNSKNVLNAVRLAKKMKMRTVGLTGKSGGALFRACDFTIRVPSDNTARIQEAHIAIIHIICELIEEAFLK